MLLSSFEFFPQISDHLCVFFRSTFALLFLLYLGLLFPNRKRLLLSEKWGGYVVSKPKTEWAHNPVMMHILFAIALLSGGLLLTGIETTFSSAYILVYSYYYFISLRWDGLARGMGAPGFMTFWLSAAVFFIELIRTHAPELLRLSVLVFQVDFAFIMLAAGISKFKSGYLQNDGMDLGMVNPMWGYWPNFFNRFNPNNQAFKFINHCAWLGEVSAAILMLIPQTRFLGGIIIALSFLFVMTQIRLGVLCPMLISACFIYAHPGSFFDVWIGKIISATPSEPHTLWPLARMLVAGFLWTYLILRPLAFLAQCYNHYLLKKLPTPFQWFLEKFTNTFGIIMWRVFTRDLINFYIEIEADRNGKNVKVSKYESILDSRFNFVVESIAVCCIFTSQKYYPSQPQIFKERLVRYAKTLRVPDATNFTFRFIGIFRKNDRYQHIPLTEYRVNTVKGTVEERTLETAPEFSKEALNLDAHETANAGTYAPMGVR